MITIEQAPALRGALNVPGDKSISHRSVMLGALAEGDTYVRGFLKGADCLATIDCFRKMGIGIEEKNGDTGHFSGVRKDEPILVIHGQGLHGLKEPETALLNAENSGTTVRLLSGILAGQPFVSRITGDSSLQKRPMGRIIRPLEQMGIRVTSDQGNDCVPLKIYGGRPSAIRYESKIASAQVKSCVLFAGLYADEPTFYTEPSLSRNHTELMLSAFGANLKVRRKTSSDAVTTILYPGTLLRPQNIAVPGDISSAAYFLAAGLIVPDARITLKNVGINETRDGIIRVIQAMGGRISVNNVRMEGCEPTADISVSSSALHGTVIGGSLIPTLIDEIPIIAILAACAEGQTVIRDAAELKVKETNRLEAISNGLGAMGISVTETEDGLIIRGGTLHGAEINPNGDHRMAMAFAIAGLVSETPVTITDEACVSVSYPNFFADLDRLR